MKFKVLVAVFLFINFSHSEKLESQRANLKIVGGQIIEIESAPYFASVIFNNKHHCGGSIISNQWILTGAHCSVTNVPADYKVRTGSSRATRGGTIFEVDHIISHPNYTASIENNDFMLIKLKKKMLFTDRQQPIKLASFGKVIEDETEVLTCGFGRTENKNESSEFLRAVVIKVASHESCLHIFPTITDNMICAGSKDGKDSCQVCTLLEYFLIYFNYFSLICIG